MKTIKYLDIFNTLKNNSINVESNLDFNTSFSKINSILSSKNNDLTFFSNSKYLEDLKKTKAKACLIEEKDVKFLPNNCTAIIVDKPYLSLACLSNLFNIYENESNGIISNDVYIEKDVKLSKDIQIDSYSCIKNNTEIGNRVKIGSNSKIGPNVLIEKNCIIHDNVSISNSTIKENCIIQSGARIGGSGFGFEEFSKQKINHIGNVIINKNTTIGCNTTIDRAVFDSTIIGEYSQIDNLVQIAHNVIIGKHAIIAAQVGIAGSTIIGNNIKIGGQAGILGHLKIGNNVIIAGKSGVTKSLSDNKIVAGFPAKDIKVWKKNVIKFNKLK